MSDASIGYGAKLRLSGTEIDEVTSITPPATESSDVEVTHLQSPDGYKEYISGLLDGSEVKFDFNFIAGNASHNLVISTAQARTVVTWQIELPDGTIFEFDGKVKFTPGPIEPNGAMKASGTIKVTGSVDYDA